MLEAKGDPAIKLFGKTIPLVEIPPPASVGADSATPVRPSDIPVDGSIDQNRPNSPEGSNNSDGIGEDREPDKV